MATTLRNLTDDQLLSTSLVIKDLTHLAGAVEYPPDPELRPEIIGEYHFDTKTESAVRCCHCSRHQKHWNGFVVTNETGKLHLLGSNCGTKHYGFAFSQAKREHSAMVSRQKYVRRIREIAGRAEEVMQALAGYSSDQTVAALWAKQADLRKASDTAYTALESMALGGQSLFVNDRVRDFEREARRNDNEESALRPGEKGELFKLERRLIGQVQGAGFFRRRTEFQRSIDECKRALTAIVEAERGGTDNFTPQQLVRLSTDLNNAGRELLQLFEALSGASSFFQQDNVTRVAQWAASVWTKHFEIRPTRGGIGLKVIGGQATEVARLEPVTLPSRMPWTEDD